MKAMKYHFKFAALSLVIASATGAWADDFEIAGTTAGSEFGNLTTTITKPHSKLVYSDATFDFSTISNSYSLGNTSGTVNNLGLFTLTETSPSTSLDTYTGETFSLKVTFTLPTVISGSNSASFSTVLFGKVGLVGSNLSSSLVINWQNDYAMFNFANPNGFGWFDITVLPTAIHFDAGSNVAVVPVTAYGNGDFTPVPAPAAVAPFAVGLVGFIRRRRR